MWTLSVQLERSYQRFTAFYASRHSGRKLTWLYHLSKGELVTNCFKNRYSHCTLHLHGFLLRTVFLSEHQSNRRRWWIWIHSYFSDQYVTTSLDLEELNLLLFRAGTHCRPPPSRWPSCCSTTLKTATPCSSSLTARRSKLWAQLLYLCYSELWMKSHSSLLTSFTLLFRIFWFRFCKSC